MRQNNCYTYFKIVGEFDPDSITKLLKLQPEVSWKIGDVRPNGKAFDFAHWEFGMCSEYDVEVSNQMRKSISKLKEKVHLLKKIHEENDVSFYLQIVPTICLKDTTPCLAPTLDIIDFCHATRTEIDIDLYIVEADSE